jgi:hypothetical protein
MIVLLTSEDDPQPIRTNNLTVYPCILLDQIYNQHASYKLSYITDHSLGRPYSIAAYSA